MLCAAPSSESGGSKNVYASIFYLFPWCQRQLCHWDYFPFFLPHHHFIFLTFTLFLYFLLPRSAQIFSLFLFVLLAFIFDPLICIFSFLIRYSSSFFIISFFYHFLRLFIRIQENFFFFLAFSFDSLFQAISLFLFFSFFINFKYYVLCSPSHSKLWC